MPTLLGLEGERALRCSWRRVAHYRLPPSPSLLRVSELRTETVALECAPLRLTRRLQARRLARIAKLHRARSVLRERSSEAPKATMDEELERWAKAWQSMEVKHVSIMKRAQAAHRFEAMCVALEAVRSP